MVHERQVETLGRTMSGVGPDNVQKFWTLSARVGLCPIGGLWKRNFYSKYAPFLSYMAPNQMKLGHMGHLNARNKFMKDIFFQIQGFSFQFWMNSKN
jgi:hypothetical protein